MEKQIPLAVKYETRPLWDGAKSRLGVGSSGAAIAISLYEAFALGGNAVSYSRSRTYYDNRATHPLLSYRKVLGAVETLDRGGFIEHFKQAPGGRGWQSAMLARETLLEVVDSLLDGKRLALELPRLPVLIRDAEGAPLPLPRNREVAKISNRLSAINEAIISLDVRHETGVPIGSALSRIFNGGLGRGGRFYAAGTSWQNIPRIDRKKITIDGEEMVELDYSTLHPAMLYAEVGVPLPPDCYCVGGWPRALVKKALLILINARSLAAAKLSVAHCEEMQALAPETHDHAEQYAAKLIRDIKEAHKPIARFFHSDAGGRLMRVDSDLAEDVQLQLHSRGVVALPVHDSFLVPASKRDQLEGAMIDAAHKAGLPSVRIKQA